LKPALRLTGHVTDPNGLSIPAAVVKLIAHSSSWRASVGAEITADTDGNFEIIAVPPPQEDFYYCVGIDAAGFCPVGYQRISVGQATERQVKLGTFVLQPLNMSVSGVVVDANGRPVPNITVHLSPSRGSEGQPRKHTRADEAGKFFFNRISKGPLRLQAGSASQNNVGFADANAGDGNVKVILGQKPQAPITPPVQNTPMTNQGIK
jgi:hypothetical protein